MPNRDRRLAELAAISQLFGAVNGPQVRQQEGQQQNALAILGLLMQQQKQQEALGQSAKFHGDETASQAAQLAEITRFHDAELGQKTADSAQRAKELADANTLRLKEAGLHNIFADPTLPIKQKLAGATALDPMFGGIGPAMTQQGTQDMTEKAAPGFKMAYLAGAKDPKVMNTQLDALKAALPEDVYNNQDWTTLNQSLPSPAAQAAATAPRTGGLFGQGGEFDFRSTIPPELEAQYNQQPKPPGLLDYILGSKPGVQQAPPVPLHWKRLLGIE